MFSIFLTEDFLLPSLLYNFIYCHMHDDLVYKIVRISCMCVLLNIDKIFKNDKIKIYLIHNFLLIIIQVYKNHNICSNLTF
jgi:hypothetical protein